MKVDFLISSERSGSNLITKLIDNHSLYCGPTPPHLIRTFAPNIKKYGDLSNDENWDNFTTDILEFHNCKIGIWVTNLEKNDLINLEDRSLASIVKYIYLKEAISQLKTNLFIKEVKTYQFVDFINQHFNSSKFIWLVRDPRDMALSWSISPVHRGDIIRASTIWKEDQKKTISIYNKLSSENRIHLIKYEDLIIHQTEVLKSVCNFLSIEFETTMVDFHLKKISTENAVQSSGWKNLNKKILTKNSKKFLEKLTKEQIQVIEYICQTEMLFLGYDFEHPILNENEFKIIYEKLILKERNEKPEYQLIDESEKVKRQKWYDKYLTIQS